MRKTSNTPFAKRFRAACEDDGIGTEKGRDLIARGEWISYRDGSTRMVTLASIEARRARLLEEATGAFEEPADLRRTRRNRSPDENEQARA